MHDQQRPSSDSVEPPDRSFSIYTFRWSDRRLTRLAGPIPCTKSSNDLNWSIACDDEGSVYYCLPPGYVPEMTDGPTVMVSAGGVTRQVGRYSSVLSNDRGVYGVRLGSGGNIRVFPLERGALPAIAAFTIPKPFPKIAVYLACSDSGEFWAVLGPSRPNAIFTADSLFWPGFMMAVWDRGSGTFTRADTDSDLDDSFSPAWVAPADGAAYLMVS